MDTPFLDPDTPPLSQCPRPAGHPPRPPWPALRGPQPLLHQRGEPVTGRIPTPCPTSTQPYTQRPPLSATATPSLPGSRRWAGRPGPGLAQPCPKGESLHSAHLLPRTAPRAAGCPQGCPQGPRPCSRAWWPGFPPRLSAPTLRNLPLWHPCHCPPPATPMALALQLTGCCPTDSLPVPCVASQETSSVPGVHGYLPVPTRLCPGPQPSSSFPSPGPCVEPGALP